MNKFDETLSSILKLIEENPAADIDELVAAKMSELGVSAEAMKTLKETNSYLEAYDEMYSRLKAAQNEGKTRVVWVQNELWKIAEKHHLTDEQKEQLCSDMASACEDSLKTTLEEGK